MEHHIFVCGDTALQVEFGDRVISLENNSWVNALYQQLQEEPILGVRECVVTYRCLTVQYDPCVIRFGALKDALDRRIACLRVETEETEQIVTEIPVLYGGELGPDLAYVAQIQGVEEAEIVRMHTANLSYVYMLGFSAGHAYTAREKDPFVAKRCTSPKLLVPPRSVMVVEERTNIIPFYQPTGWHVIGSTPLAPTDYRRQQPFLFRPGMWLKFVAVSEQEYREISEMSEAGAYRCRTFQKGAAQ